MGWLGGDAFPLLLTRLDTLLSLGMAMSVSLRVIAGFNDVAVMGNAVKQCCGHLRIQKHTGPFCEDQICRDDHAGVFIQTREQMEQQGASRLAEGQIQKRSDLEYQQHLWERRHDTDKVIGQLLAESAALRAWSHFFARLSTKESAALKSWREAVRAMGKGTGKSAKMERLQYWQCSACREQTTATCGTIFESTKLPLTTWFLAMHLLTQSKNSVAALELKRHLGVRYKTA